MVGWVTSPFFSFLFLKASVLCTCINFHVCKHVAKGANSSLLNFPNPPLNARGSLNQGSILMIRVLMYMSVTLRNVMLRNV